MKIFFPFRLSTDISTLTAMSFRNKGHLLQRIIAKLFLIGGGKTRTSIHRGIYVIVQRLLEIKKHQGLRGLTSYLKVCSVSTQQALGGMVHSNLTDLNTRVHRTAKGIPTILPVSWRHELFYRPVLCRLILSIFAVYRFFLYESPVKVKEITNPYTGSPTIIAELSERIPAFFYALQEIGAFDTENEPSYKIGSIFAILTKGPTTKSLPDLPPMPKTTGRARSGVHPPLPITGTKSIWSSHRLSVLRSWLILNSDQYESIWKDLTSVAELFHVPLHLEIKSGIARYLSKGLSPSWLGPTVLGKLGLKQEAAGKMRVFAMVDPITQWVLYPIHRYIFDNILNHIPMDGTFNQTKPLFRGVGRWKCLYSLDLSSATDRLPIDLQVNIINFMWPEVGDKWKNILVNRDYSLPGSNSTVRYAVGQPMGAYSSWAMLALTHHFIVQVSAWRACVLPVGTFFTEYAILGDDIVIANKTVKNEYLKVLDLLGVKCGLHKSILSPSGSALEFAKRTWHHFTDVSPITVKELAAALMSPTALVSLMNHHKVPLTTALKVAGFGYKVIGGLNKPFHKLNLAVRNTILTTILPSEVETASELFGRSSLTKISWTPEFGDNQLILLLQGLLQEVCDSTLKFTASNIMTFGGMSYHPSSLDKLYKPAQPGGIFTKYDVAQFSVITKQSELAATLIERIKQTVDALNNPTWASMTDPLEVLKEYQYCLRESVKIKGMTNTESCTAKFGVDPFTVKMWKFWSQAVAALTRFNSNKKDNDE